MSTVDHPHACPWCGRAHDQVTGVSNGGAAPRPGDVTLCAFCAGPGIFTPLGLRRPTPAELTVLTEDEGLQGVRRALGPTLRGPERGWSA